MLKLKSFERSVEFFTDRVVGLHGEQKIEQGKARCVFCGYQRGMLWNFNPATVPYAPAPLPFVQALNVPLCDGCFHFALKCAYGGQNDALEPEQSAFLPAVGFSA